MRIIFLLTGLILLNDMSAQSPGDATPDWFRHSVSLTASGGLMDAMDCQFLWSDSELDQFCEKGRTMELRGEYMYNFNKYVGVGASGGIGYFDQYMREGYFGSASIDLGTGIPFGKGALLFFTGSGGARFFNGLVQRENTGSYQVSAVLNSNPQWFVHLKTGFQVPFGKSRLVFNVGRFISIDDVFTGSIGQPAYSPGGAYYVRDAGRFECIGNALILGVGYTYGFGAPKAKN
jgi:hypothetical protein